MTSEEFIYLIFYEEKNDHFKLFFYSFAVHLCEKRQFLLFSLNINHHCFISCIIHIFCTINTVSFKLNTSFLLAFIKVVSDVL